jgi:hypothetical protein
VPSGSGAKAGSHPNHQGVRQPYSPASARSFRTLPPSRQICHLKSRATPRPGPAERLLPPRPPASCAHRLVPRFRHPILPNFSLLVFRPHLAPLGAGWRAYYAELVTEGWFPYEFITIDWELFKALLDPLAISFRVGRRVAKAGRQEGDAVGPPIPFNPAHGASVAGELASPV